ncbi:uncharacterized protein BDV14DRAFT_164461 [Aspergillus stella-maris]|uniref:uncharacterized protein n=1 Tax=Aspergillus stella-maris TaxID=1810926 RepID=UPI003CCD0840
MRAFWRSPWMTSKISLGDGQHEHLLPDNQELEQLSTKATQSQGSAPRERYVGFGIGGAGNIRKVKQDCHQTKTVEAKDN